ncbi:MAG: hypothetical protein LBR80_09040 [Deltaproteobacteria bacterium]|jgi:hypothetical protein|nr:hypothetical protein [Deltaproteobacteria bacterium]
MDREDNPFALWRILEELLASQDPDSHWLATLPPQILEWSGLSWAFITEVFEEVTSEYYIRASWPEVPGLKQAHPMDGGLAGWVHTHLLPLAKDRLNTGENFTYIFSQPEPIRKPTSFYGWPLVYNGKPMGGLVLAGAKGQTLNAPRLEFFSALAARLSAHANHMRLNDRVNELKRLDFQTGLPHRANFLDRLERLMDIMGVQHQALCLKIICVSGLGRYSLTHTPEDTQSLLRKIASQFLHFASDYWELGHVSYGIFAVAVPEAVMDDLDRCIAVLKKSLNEWSSAGRVVGQPGFVFHESQAFFPQDGDRPESLLENALSLLAEST